jgi:hypothetical protein
MKKHIMLGLLAASTLFLNGCKLIDELRTFDIPYSVEFTIPSSTILNLPINLPTASTTTNSEQRFQDEGIESAWIESIKLSSLKITITAPAGEDFSFLENISMYMNTDGQPEVLIADKVAVPENAGNSIQLEVKGADLYPYISQNDFTLKTSITTDETVTQDVDFRTDMVIEVKATIPGGN